MEIKRLPIALAWEEAKTFISPPPMIQGSLLATPAKSGTGWEVQPGAGNRGAHGVFWAPVARRCVGRRKGRAGLSGALFAGLGSDSLAQGRKGGVRVPGAGSESLQVGRRRSPRWWWGRWRQQAASSSVRWVW